MKPNGGFGWSQDCDNPEGPCGCGAWHKPEKALEARWPHQQYEQCDDDSCDLCWRSVRWSTQTANQAIGTGAIAPHAVWPSAWFHLRQVALAQQSARIGFGAL